MSVPEPANFIAGDWAIPDNGLWVDNVNPATGETMTEVPRSDAPDVERAVAAAVDAFPAWAATPADERAAVLERAAELITDDLEALALAETRDTGKPIRLSRAIDIPRAVRNLRFYAGAVRHDETACHETADALNYTLRRPLGPVALVTPWNLPLYLLTWKVAPALACGNTVIAKPSEMTPTTATALADILQRAGLPDGVFNLVHGLGPEAGQRLVEHPDVKAVSFTGGTATGRTVAATAAPQFKKLSLELGGKNPTIVFADADFEKAVEGAARAGFTNTGQVCLCGSRVLVERGIHDEFRAALVERVAAMRVGDPEDPETELGALISADHRDKVESYIALAREEGGEILAGGGRPGDLPDGVAGGAFVQPTVVGGLPSTCRTATEEIFGPVVSLHPFDGVEEAIRMGSETSYGLCASVWTTDLDKAHRVGSELETGMLWVNTWLLRDLRTPFGGVKNSGVGREGGRHSLEFFTEARNICIRR